MSVGLIFFILQDSLILYHVMMYSSYKLWMKELTNAIQYNSKICNLTEEISNKTPNEINVFTCFTCTGHFE